MEPALPTSLYDKKTFFTLGGASLGVWLFTTVLASVFDVDITRYKWIGLCVALVISYVGASRLKFDVQLVTIAFFNGLLIFVTASGVESINQGVAQSKGEAQKGALLSFSEGKAWWPTQSLVAEVDGLTKKNDSLKTQVAQLEQVKLVVRDTCLTKQGNAVVVQPGANDAALKQQIVELQQEIERLKSINNSVSDPVGEARVLLKEIRLSNKDLLDNLNIFLTSENPGTQAEALRIMKTKAAELKTKLDEYNNTLTQLINK